MIKIAHLEPFAGGRKRDCYFHPDDPEKIIKVIPRSKSPEVLMSEKFWLRRLLQNPESLNANVAESKRFEVLKAKFGNVSERIPYLAAYFGKSTTDLGEGLVFQAVKSFDGSIAKNVDKASEAGGYDKAILLSALKRLASHTEDGLIYNDVGKQNVVVQVLDRHHSKYKLWVVDGIQCGHLIPISDYSATYANLRKAKKIWQLKRFIQKNF